MPTYPSINDREFNLLKKIAENTADMAAGGGGGGGAVWGGITGDLANQADLQSALDAKIGSGDNASVGSIQIGAGGNVLATVFRMPLTHDFGSIAAGASADQVFGVLLGAPAFFFVETPNGLNAGLIPQIFTTAADSVTLRLTNVSAAAINPGSFTFYAVGFEFV